MTDERLALLHGEAGLGEDYRDAVLSTIMSQTSELPGMTTCPCNEKWNPFALYRCFHCSIRWCYKCSPRHFGSRPGRGPT